MGNKSTKKAVSRNPQNAADINKRRSTGDLLEAHDEDVKEEDGENDGGEKENGIQEQPFHLAAKNGNADFFDELLESCNSLMASTNNRPIPVAAKKQHTQLVELIVKHRCRIYDTVLKNVPEFQGNYTNLVEEKCNTPIELFKSDGRRVFAEIIWAEISTPLEIMQESPDGYNALDLAVRSIQPEMVKQLLSVNQCAYSEKHLRLSFIYMIETIMRLVENDSTRELTFTKFKEIADVLMDSGQFNLNAQLHGFDTPLHSVIEECRYCSSEYIEGDATRRPLRIQIIDYVVQLLLLKGADFNMKNTFGETPLMVASKNECCHIIQILFDWEEKSGMKLDLDAIDQNGATALIKAAEKRRVAAMRLLLNHKVSVNLHDYSGFTALHAAVYAPNKIWLAWHYSCKNFCKREFGNLHNEISIENCKQTLRLKEEIVKLLLSVNETNVNAIDLRGNTPLDLAVNFSQLITLDTIEALKHSGAIPKFPASEASIHVPLVDDRGRSSLHRLSLFLVSCHSELGVHAKGDLDYEIFDLMSASIWLKPANFRQSANAADVKGRTPLHYAVMAPTYTEKEAGKLVRLLLDIGSKVNATDVYGKIPLHYAETNDMYALLIAYGAEENTKDKNGQKPKTLMQLRESARSNTNKAKKLRIGKKELYASSDISLVRDTDHVTQLSKRKVAQTLRVRSQSPRPEESPEEAIWQLWIQNDFLRLNRRLSHLTQLIQRLSERLADSIKERDPRFECQPILVGSAGEGTKAVISADFDFNFKLIQFSQLCDVFPHLQGPEGYFQLRRRRDNAERRQSDDEFACFFDLDQCLLTNKVNSRFQIVLGDVLHNHAFWQDEHLFEWHEIDIYEDRSHESVAPLCKTVHLRMINPIEDGEGGFIFTDVSIDVVGCVQVDDTNLVHQLPIATGTASKADYCTFVFDRPSAYGSVFSDTFARISFAPLESRVIRESSSLVKVAYMVCKLIFYYYPKATYNLKTSILFCIEALKVRNRCEKREEDTITQKELAFWVERITFCLTEFCRLGFYPCYFMPSFRQKVCAFLNFSTLFRYSAAFDIYLDLCPDDTEINIPIVLNSADGSLIANEEEKLEQFNREEFVEKLFSCIIPSIQRNSDVVQRNTTVFDS